MRQSIDNGSEIGYAVNWVAVKELKLPYHNSDTILTTIYIPSMETSSKLLNSNPVNSHSCHFNADEFKASVETAGMQTSRSTGSMNTMAVLGQTVRAYK